MVSPADRAKPPPHALRPVCSAFLITRTAAPALTCCRAYATYPGYRRISPPDVLQQVRHVILACACQPQQRLIVSADPASFPSKSTPSILADHAPANSRYRQIIVQSTCFKQRFECGEAAGHQLNIILLPVDAVAGFITGIVLLAIPVSIRCPSVS